MPWPTYSERFVLAGPELGTYRYNVPAGRRIAIKWVGITNYASVASAARISVNGKAVWYRDFPVTERWSGAAVMIVAYALEYVDIYLDHAPMYGSLSGFSFEDPASAAAPESDHIVLPRAEQLPALERPS